MTIEQKALERRAEETLTKAYQEVDEWRRRAWDAETAHEADKSRHAAEMREQAERFSDAAKRALNIGTHGAGAPLDSTMAYAHLAPFILAPDDPLVEVLNEVMPEVTGEGYGVVDADALRAALDARGLAIVKKEAVNG